MAWHAAILALGCMSITAASPAATAVVPVYFANGCYWGTQNLFVEKFERAVLGRADTEVTSLAGYAGSSRAGPDGQLCYYNDQNISYYAALGHAEATQVQVPDDSLEAAFSVFFGAFTSFVPGVFDRPDYFDAGANFRAMIGVPGGTANVDAMAAAQRANINGMALREGQGSDADTFFTNTVLVMDSDRFPFAQAEPCMQFYDDSAQGVFFNASYLALRQELEDNGRIIDTACPPVYLCDSSARASVV